MSEQHERLPHKTVIRTVAGDYAALKVVSTYYAASRQLGPLTIPEEELSAARALLETMPLGFVPHHEQLPQGSRMVFEPNPHFVGREQALLELARTLRTRHNAAITPTAAIIGMGGIGKTQLAVEFVYRYGQFFAGGVFWLSFAQADLVPSEVAACCQTLHPLHAGLPIEEQIPLMLASWQTPLPRLLIFDNCEDVALLDAWRPKMGGCHVLITSRQSWPRRVPALGLPTLPRAESVTLLCRDRADLDQSDLTLIAIAEELDDLPLALHLAGSFLAAYAQPPSYLAALREQRSRHRATQVHGGEDGPTEHDAVDATSNLALVQLDPAQPSDALSHHFLACAMCLAPDTSLPAALLQAYAGSNAVAIPGTGDVLDRLVNMGLMEHTGAKELRIHGADMRLIEEALQKAYPSVAAQQPTRLSLWAIIGWFLAIILTILIGGYLAGGTVPARSQIIATARIQPTADGPEPSHGGGIASPTGTAAVPPSPTPTLATVAFADDAACSEPLQALLQDESLATELLQITAEPHDPRTLAAITPAEQGLLATVQRDCPVPGTVAITLTLRPPPRSISLLPEPERFSLQVTEEQQLALLRGALFWSAGDHVRAAQNLAPLSNSVKPGIAGARLLQLSASALFRGEQWEQARRAYQSAACALSADPECTLDSAQPTEERQLYADLRIGEALVRYHEESSGKRSPACRSETMSMIAETLAAFEQKPHAPEENAQRRLLHIVYGLLLYRCPDDEENPLQPILAEARLAEDGVPFAAAYMLAALAWNRDFNYEQAYNCAMSAIGLTKGQRLREADQIAGLVLVRFGRPVDATSYFELHDQAALFRWEIDNAHEERDEAAQASVMQPLSPLQTPGVCLFDR